MATIVTGVGAGTLSGRLTFDSPTSLWRTTIRAAIDSTNYVDIYLELAPGPYVPWLATVVPQVIISGQPTAFGSGSVFNSDTFEFPMVAPSFELTYSSVGRGFLMIEFEITSGLDTYSAKLDAVPLWGGSFVFDLSNPLTTGTSFVWEDAPPYVPPTPPTSPWYSKQYETVIEDGYGEFVVPIAYPTLIDIYSNDTQSDPDTRLISIELQEYFDPTTQTTTSNSCIVTIKTPLNDTSTPTEIEAFLSTFTNGTVFWVNRGWMSAGVADVVSMGYYRVESDTLELNKNQWTLTLGGNDIFWYYTTSLVNYQYQDIAPTDAIDLLGLYSDSPSNSIMTLPTGVGWPLTTFINVLDRSGTPWVYLTAPISNTTPTYDLIGLITNAIGGRWYLETTGRWTLELGDGHATWDRWLDYKITPHMVYGKPSENKYVASTTPYTANLYDYSYELVSSDLGVVPQIRTEGRIFRVNHEGGNQQALYERSGGVDTITAETINYQGLYSTQLDGGVWIKSTGPTVYYESLVLKGNKLIVTSAANDDSSSEGEGTTLDNPFITQVNQADAALSWSFPDFERQWDFEMRDDPALKCGHVVQLAVDNEYLNVLIVDIKRTFSGAGRMSARAVYISDTGESVYETAVENATATFLDETSPITGLDFAWDNVSGYDYWPNLDLKYRIYKTSTDPDVLLGTVTYPTNTLEDIAIAGLTSADTFGVRVVTNNLEWAITPCTNVYYDNTDADDRLSGEFMFYAGQDRLW